MKTGQCSELRSQRSVWNRASGVGRPTFSPRPPTSDLRLPASGFTLFELLAVLTVIGIVLVALLGSYGSWGTAHAVSGAANVVESGLQQARTLARANNTFVAFRYGTETTNEIQTISGFQVFLCTNDSALVAAEVGSPYPASTPPLTDLQIEALLKGLQASPGAPYQRLSSHIRLAYQPEAVTENSKNLSVLIFRPDGSAWSAGDSRCHYVCVCSKELFAMGKTRSDNTDTPKPLMRILRVDLATGAVTTIKEEATP